MINPNDLRITLRTLRSRLEGIEAEEERKIERIRGEYRTRKEGLRFAIADVEDQIGERLPLRDQAEASTVTSPVIRSNGYPENGSLREKITYTLRRNHRTLSTSEIRSFIMGFEPDLSRPASIRETAHRMFKKKELVKFKIDGENYYGLTNWVSSDNPETIEREYLPSDVLPDLFTSSQDEKEEEVSETEAKARAQEDGYPLEGTVFEKFDYSLQVLGRFSNKSEIEGLIKRYEPDRTDAWFSSALSSFTRKGRLKRMTFGSYNYYYFYGRREWVNEEDGLVSEAYMPNPEQLVGADRSLMAIE